MLLNPFNKPILPIEKTDREGNAKILEAFLGPDAASQGLLGESQVTPAISPEDVARKAREMLAGSSDVLHNAQEKVFRADISVKFEKEIKNLIELSLLETKDGVLGITAIDSKFYPLPTSEQVVNYFTSPDKMEFFLKKREQGFTKMVLTPIGKPLSFFEERMDMTLKKHHKEGNPLDRDKNRLKLETNQPLWVSNEFKDGDTSGKLLYNPTTLNSTTGQTKQELLSDSNQPFPGFRITFIQEDLTIPRAGQGTEVGGRPALETNKSGIDYLALTQDSESSYFKEQGLTPEDWYTLFLTTLHTTNTVIDDNENGIDSTCRLIGAITKTNNLPHARWYRSVGIASLDWFDSGSAGPAFGVRLAVG